MECWYPSTISPDNSLGVGQIRENCMPAALSITGRARTNNPRSTRVTGVTIGWRWPEAPRTFPERSAPEFKSIFPTILAAGQESKWELGGRITCKHINPIPPFIRLPAGQPANGNDTLRPLMLANSVSFHLSSVPDRGRVARHELLFLPLSTSAPRACPRHGEIRASHGVDVATFSPRQRSTHKRAPRQHFPPAWYGRYPGAFIRSGRAGARQQTQAVYNVEPLRVQLR